MFDKFSSKTLRKLAFPLWCVGTVALVWRERNHRYIGAIPLSKTETWAIETPLVSVLVAAWNEAILLPHLLHSFEALRYPNKELILCVGGEDDSEHVARQWACASVRILKQHKGEGKRGALARCLEHAQGQVVFLTDADCVLNDAGFEGMIRPIIEKTEQVTTGTYRPLREQQTDPFIFLQWAKIHQRERRDGDYVKSHILGINTATTAALYRTYLPQIPTDTLVEDGVFGLLLHRDGVPIRWLPQYYVETELYTHMRPYIQQQSRWLRGAWQTGQQFKAPHIQTHARRTAQYGFYLLLLPFLSIPLGLFGLAIALIGWSSALAIYVRLGKQLNVTHPLWTPHFWGGAIRLLLADCIVWTRALTIDLWFSKRHKRW